VHDGGDVFVVGHVLAVPVRRLHAHRGVEVAQVPPVQHRRLHTDANKEDKFTTRSCPTRATRTAEMTYLHAPRTFNKAASQFDTHIAGGERAHEVLLGDAAQVRRVDRLELLAELLHLIYHGK
jgi:hypothetical protein